MTVRGDTASGFEPIADAFAAITDDSLPAALTVLRAGRPVVELSHGADATGRDFTAATPVFLFSVAKPVAALSALLAIADGRVGLDVPVAAMWPSFRAHGKGRVTVRELLAHGAAVPGWREQLSVEQLGERKATAEMLAQAAPWWPPGEPGEHAMSYGHLLDAVLRYSTGEDITAWWGRMRAVTGADVSLRPGQGAAAPALLDDPDRSWQRTTEQSPGRMGALLRNPPGLLDPDVLNGPQGRALIAPAITGYGSARSLAELWQWWIGPGAVDRLGRVLRDASLRPQLVGHDHVLGEQVRWGLGPQVDEDFIGLGGVGGCVAGHDPVRELSLAFTTPRLGSLDRLDPLYAALAGLS